MVLLALVLATFGPLDAQAGKSSRFPTAPAASACERYREVIDAALALARGRDAMAIWRDLIDHHGFPAQYASVRRVVITLRGQRPAEAQPVIVTTPGEDC